MKEIKFRAWDKDRTGAFNSFLEQTESIYEFFIELQKRRAEYGCDFEFMQYTGLKDKNGKEIYEFCEIDKKFEVGFKNGSYVLTSISTGDIIYLYNYYKEKNGQIEITREYTKI